MIKKKGFLIEHFLRLSFNLTQTSFAPLSTISLLFSIFTLNVNLLVSQERSRDDKTHHRGDNQDSPIYIKEFDQQDGHAKIYSTANCVNKDGYQPIDSIPTMIVFLQVFHKVISLFLFIFGIHISLYLL